MSTRTRRFANTLQFLSMVWEDAARLTKTELLLVLGLVITASVLTVLPPIALKLLIDELSESSSVRTDLALLFVAVYVGTLWLSRTLKDLYEFLYAKVERNLHRLLSRRMFDNLLALPLAFHLRRKTGALNETLSQGLAGLAMVLQTLLTSLLPVVIQITAVSVVLLQIDQPIILAIILASMVAYGLVFWSSAASVAAPSRAASTATIESHAQLTDGILNYEAIKQYVAESAIVKRYDRTLAHAENSWIQLARKLALNGVKASAVFAVSLVLTLLHAAMAVISGTLTIGDFVMISTFMFMLVGPLELLGVAFQRLSQGLGFMNNLIALFDEPRESNRGVTTGPTVPPLRGHIEFKNVEFGYTRNERVLSKLSFTIPAGRTLGIVGASGGGKSTIVRLLIRMFDPTSGTILIDGMSVSEIPLTTLRQLVTVVPQDSLLFNESLAYNMAFGQPNSQQVDIERAACIAQLQSLIAGLPDGYQTPIGERGLRLSGGERQRVSIARAMLRPSSIYVFDEATSFLDSATERAVLSNLRTSMRPCTAIFIAHRLASVKYVDEIIVLVDGTVAERGAHDELLLQQGRYAALWEKQERSTAVV